MPGSVDLSPTGSTTVDATGVSGDPDDMDGDQTVDIFLTGCASSDARFDFSSSVRLGSVVNKDQIFPTASAIEPSTVVTAGNTARRRAVGDPGGGMVTVSGKTFHPDAQFICGGTDISIPPDVRTTVTNSDGTVTEVQASSEEVMNWQNAGTSAIIANADKKRRASHNGSRRLLEFHEESPGQRRRALQNVDPTEVLPADFWNGYLSSVVRTYQSALKSGTVQVIRPPGSAAQTAAEYRSHAAEKHLSLGHRLTEADRHTCDDACMQRRRRRRAVVEPKSKAQDSHVSVETMRSNAHMKVTTFGP